MNLANLRTAIYERFDHIPTELPPALLRLRSWSIGESFPMRDWFSAMSSRVRRGMLW